jgi:hypothetical protein
MSIRNSAVTFALFILFSTSPNALSGLTDGLVAYFPFSGNASDASGNGNDGVVHGATPTSDRFGHLNSAYSFDGETNYIQVPSSPSLEIQDSITLSAWVYHLSNASPQHIVNMSALYSGYRLAAWWANPAGNSLELYDLSQSQNIADDGSQPYIGKWTHVAATWDGSFMRVYRDGILGGQSAFNGKISVSNNDLYIGVLNPIPWPIQGYFHGYIDDVRLYNRALSESEINQLMATSVAIDMFPKNAKNPINPHRGGYLRVAILTDDEFDALQVDPGTVTFGPNEIAATKSEVRDVDNDGDADVLLYFMARDTGISCNDTSATLFGTTYGGVAIAGETTFDTTGCKQDSPL